MLWAVKDESHNKHMQLYSCGSLHGGSKRQSSCSLARKTVQARGPYALGSGKRIPTTSTCNCIHVVLCMRDQSASPACSLARKPVQARGAYVLGIPTTSTCEDKNDFSWVLQNDSSWVM